MTNEVYVELAKMIESNFYTYVGVRHCCEDEVANVGDTLRDSYDWDFESDVSAYHTTGQQLDGVAALSIDNGKLEDYLMDEDFESIAALIEKALTASEIYRSNEGDIVLVAGQKASYGTDEDEIIIREAKVIHKF